MRILRLDPKYLKIKPYGKYHEYPKVSKHVIEEVLKRCGRYLIKINVDQLEFDCMYLVAEYCKNIQYIICDRVALEELKQISLYCKNLLELRIQLYIELHELEKIEKALAELFSNNRKLSLES